MVDCNYPAHSSAAGTVSGRVVELPGFSAPEAIGLITALMPLDPFAAHGALWMQADGRGETPEPVHEEALAILAREMPEGGAVGSVGRQEFYGRAPGGLCRGAHHRNARLWLLHPSQGCDFLSGGRCPLVRQWMVATAPPPVRGVSKKKNRPPHGPVFQSRQRGRSGQVSAP